MLPLMLYAREWLIVLLILLYFFISARAIEMPCLILSHWFIVPCTLKVASGLFVVFGSLFWLNGHKYRQHFLPIVAFILYCMSCSFSFCFAASWVRFELDLIP